MKKTHKIESNILQQNKLVAVGRVIKPQGLHGEVKVEKLSNISNRFEFLREATLELKNGDLVQYDVEHSRISGVYIILKLKGIDNRDEAEKLKGAYISVTLDKVAPLDNNSYYIFDLEGLDVFDSIDRKIGFVKKIEQYPANDVLVIEIENEDVMIPAVKDFIIKVNLKERKITVNLPEVLPRYLKRV